MKKNIISFSIITFCLLLLTKEVSAFTLNNANEMRFQNNNVYVNVADLNCQNIGISNDEMLSLVGIAIDKFWNRAPTSRLKLRKGKILPTNSIFQTDEMCQTGTNCTPNLDLLVATDILIACNNNIGNFPSSSILGITVPNNNSADTIYGALVLINDRPSSNFADKSIDEKVSIIAHEIGHAIGLGHSPVTDSLMYYATMDKRHALGIDDIDGVNYLYPKEEPISVCGTVDFDNHNHTNWWGGLFIGLALVTVFEMTRKQFKYKS